MVLLSFSWMATTGRLSSEMKNKTNSIRWNNENCLIFGFALNSPTSRRWNFAYLQYGESTFSWAGNVLLDKCNASIFEQLQYNGQFENETKTIWLNTRTTTKLLTKHQIAGIQIAQSNFKMSLCWQCVSVAETERQNLKEEKCSRAPVHRSCDRVSISNDRKDMKLFFNSANLCRKNTESFQRNNEPFAMSPIVPRRQFFSCCCCCLPQSVSPLRRPNSKQLANYLWFVSQFVSRLYSSSPIYVDLQAMYCGMRYGQTCCNVMQSTVVLNCLPIFYLLFAHCARINSWILAGKLREKTTTIFISFYVTTEIGTRCETTRGARIACMHVTW